MNIDCPGCDWESHVESEDLPKLAGEAFDHECGHCGHVFVICWNAELEILDPR